MKIRISKDLPIRMFKCFRNWTKWQQARKLDKAIVVLYKHLYKADLAYELMPASDKLWKEILGEHYIKP